MTEKEKIDVLVGELTLEEKIALIHGAGLFKSGAVPRLGIPALVMSDGPMGVRQEFKNETWLPKNNGDDFVSYLPSNSAIACTWNRKLAKKVGQVLGEEVRGRGKDISLAPGINIKRNPLCGRNFEYFSEDPVLTADLACEYIKGLQESDAAACVKHFAMNSQETDRLWVNVEIEEKPLREIYLYAFEKAAGVSYSIMCSYNLLRGVHASESEYLLGDVLRKEWGYDGAIISDWGAVHHTVASAKSPLDLEMSVTGDFDEYYFANPLKKAVEEGRVAEEALDEKVRHLLLLMLRVGKIRLLENNKKREDPSGLEAKNAGVYAVPNNDRATGAVNTAAHQKSCLETAEESVVLLKNQDHALPLDRKKVKKVLVIGDNAVKKHSAGGGSAEIKALYEKTPMMGISALAGGNIAVDYVPGYEVKLLGPEKLLNWQATSLEDDTSDLPQEPAGKRESEKEKAERLVKEAVAAASDPSYDVVLFIGGLNHDHDMEGKDRDSMKLPYGQDDLLEKLFAVRPDLITVIFAGSPVEMPWERSARTLLYMSYSGMEGGTALAEVLFGDVNPSGHLDETFPMTFDRTGVAHFGEFPGRKLKRKEQWGISAGREKEEAPEDSMSCIQYEADGDASVETAKALRMDAKRTEEYKDGIFVGYRYYDTFGVPVRFPFGYGLSYTTFEISNVRYKGGKCKATVKNTGKTAGAAVVQFYLESMETEKAREEGKAAEILAAGEFLEPKELVSFAKVFLKPGEEKEVKAVVDPRRLCSWSEKKGRFVKKKGEYILFAAQDVTDENVWTKIRL